MTEHKNVFVFWAEDDPDDYMFLQRAINKTQTPIELFVLPDGELALTYLKKKEPYTDARTPDIILLDLNLPKMDGRQLQRAIKADPTLSKIPLVVLTTSTSNWDIKSVYSDGADYYIKKPSDLNGFNHILDILLKLSNRLEK